MIDTGPGAGVLGGAWSGAKFVACQRKETRGARRSRAAIFELGPHIRYVAFGSGQEVTTSQRDDISNASASSSDFFEELIVNPALLALARQRGDLDCGGLRHIVVGYGNFDQVIVPLPDGHVSVCVDLNADPQEVAAQVRSLIGRR